MASIRKRGPYQWEARVRKKGWPIQSKTFERKDDAEDWARDIESEMRRGAFVCRKEAEQTTLSEALDRYAKEITAQKKGHQELARINVWKNHHLAQRFLATLRGADFAHYRDERLAAGKASNTVRLELAVISHLFTIAKKEWGMESLSNPVQAIRLPSPGQARDRRLVGDEEERLLDACEKSKSTALKDLVILALETAMRQGELLSLIWSNIDLQRRVAHLTDTKINGESRDVPLSSKAVLVLQRQPRSLKTDRVFFEWSSTNGLKHTWRRAVNKAGIENLHFHDLRHEATSRFFEKGLNPMQAAAITGHKDLRTLKRYTHLRAEDLAVKLG